MTFNTEDKKLWFVSSAYVALSFMDPKHGQHPQGMKKTEFPCLIRSKTVNNKEHNNKAAGPTTSY